jgi:hypothetical protein
MTTCVNEAGAKAPIWLFLGPNQRLHLPLSPPEYLKIVHPASSESTARCGHQQNALALHAAQHVARTPASGPALHHEEAPRSHSSSSQHFETPPSKFSLIPGSTLSVSSRTKLISILLFHCADPPGARFHLHNSAKFLADLAARMGSLCASCADWWRLATASGSCSAPTR